MHSQFEHVLSDLLWINYTDRSSSILVEFFIFLPHLPVLFY